LIDRPRSGRPRRHPRLTPQRLAAALARDPRRCGYQATSWTVPLLAHDLGRLIHGAPSEIGCTSLAGKVDRISGMSSPPPGVLLGG
ncbi:hypothetical protein, partial [Bradyrhizobium algeriense]